MKKLIAFLLLFFSLQVCKAEVINALVNYPAGSNVDTIARLLMKRYDELYGTATVILNKPGADGQIGIKEFADGNGQFSLLFSIQGALVAMPESMEPKVLPLIATLRQPYTLIVRKNFPASNWDEFVSYAKNNQTTIGIISPALTVPVVSDIEKRSDIKTTWIRYGGGKRAEFDVASGVLDGTWTPVNAVVGTGIENRVKIIVVAGNQRDPAMPASATMGTDKNIGLRYLYHGIYIHASVNNEYKKTLNIRFNEILKSNWAKETFVKHGISTVGGSSDEYARIMGEAKSRWTPYENLNF